METIKHYNLELEINEIEKTIEFFSTKLKYNLDVFEIGEIRQVTVILPKEDLVNMIEREFGKKSLKWFEGLYKKIEKHLEK